jgi:predicted methyltransferase
MTNRLIVIALCTLFSAGLFFAERLAWSFEADGRDKRQKPDEVIRALDLKPGQIVIDIGAGKGYFTWRLARAVAPEGKAVGIEIDSDLVEKMTEDARQRGLANYEARLVPLDDPQLAPRSVDLVFLCDTYHHINDRVAYFKKVRESLKPAGRLAILDMIRSSQNSDHSVVRDEVIEELRQAGFRLSRELDFLQPRQYFFIFESAAGEEQDEPQGTRPGDVKKTRALAWIMA